jgi:hypothetical protein
MWEIKVRRRPAKQLRVRSRRLISAAGAERPLTNFGDLKVKEQLSTPLCVH